VKQRPTLSLKSRSAEPAEPAPKIAAEPIFVGPGSDGPPVAVDLKEEHRHGLSGLAIKKLMTPEQREIIDRVFASAGGRPRHKLVWHRPL
jgi:hypothetical protein